MFDYSIKQKIAWVILIICTFVVCWYLDTQCINYFQR